MNDNSDPLARLLAQRQESKGPTPAFSQMSDAEKLLRGYGLTTAQMFYRMPDHPSVLNTFLWSFHDLAPDYPKLFEFIEFWNREIEGPLHSVAFTHRTELRPGQWRHLTAEFIV